MHNKFRRILHHWKDDHPLTTAELTGKMLRLFNSGRPYILSSLSLLKGTEELKRREALESADPVYAVLLTNFVRERLSQAQQLGMGPYWAKLDADVQRQLEKLMS
jgi:hypothetical protein